MGHQPLCCGLFSVFVQNSSKVLWDDMVSYDPEPSTRRFISMFFVDDEVDVADTVVAVRLPYDRVNITGTDPFTSLSNDVVRLPEVCM